MERNLNRRDDMSDETSERWGDHTDPYAGQPDEYGPSNYDVIAAKAQALADAAKNCDAALTTLALRDLDALMPYFKQDVLHHEFDERMADALRRD